MLNFFIKEVRLELEQKSWLSHYVKREKPSKIYRKNVEKQSIHHSLKEGSKCADTHAWQSHLIQESRQLSHNFPHLSVGLTASFTFYLSNTNDEAHNKLVVMSFLPSEWLTVLAHVLLIVCGTLISLNRNKDFRRLARRRKEARDCLLPTTGWMQEKCQECQGFLQRKEGRKEIRAFRPKHSFTYRHHNFSQ